MNRDTQTLAEFIRIFCDNKHPSGHKSQWRPSDKEAMAKREFGFQICQECIELLDYAVVRRKLCPLDPKPSCRKCKIHCYSRDYRAKIREVMRFSGTHLVKHGRIDLILHYLF